MAKVPNKPTSAQSTQTRIAEPKPLNLSLKPQPKTRHSPKPKPNPNSTAPAQEEVDAMRQLLNCNVCHERQKNRIITKCCHVFCDVCIDRTLTARNRKCPGCGIVFAKVRR